jgi:hypothetical protein
MLKSAIQVFKATKTQAGVLRKDVWVRRYFHRYMNFLHHREDKALSSAVVILKAKVLEFHILVVVSKQD